MLKIFSFALLTALAVGSPNHRCCKMGYDMDILMPICAQYCSEQQNVLIAMHPSASILEKTCCEFGMSYNMLPYCSKYCGAAELKAMQLAAEMPGEKKIVTEAKNLPAGHPFASILEQKCCAFSLGQLPVCSQYCSAAEPKAMQLSGETPEEKIIAAAKDLPAGHPFASILQQKCCLLSMGRVPVCKKYCAELQAKAPEQKKVLQAAENQRDDPAQAAKKPGPDDDDDEPPKKIVQ